MTRVDTATPTMELTENKGAAPLFEAFDPADAVLADSEMSVGVAPLMNAVPHVELMALEVDPLSKAGKSWFMML